LVASQYLIDKIDSDRRDFIEELLNSSEIEDREEVFSKLDEQLLEELIKFKQSTIRIINDI